MNIALFISNDYGLDLYDLLKKNNFNISLIVTRDYKIFYNKRFSNINKVLYNKKNINLVINKLKSNNIDLNIVFVFCILPKSIWNLPSYKSICIHFSLLYSYCGPNPVEWQVHNKETESGVSIFYINDKIDLGKIIIQDKTNIKNLSIKKVYNRLNLLMKKSIIKALGLINIYGNNVPPIEYNYKYSYYSFYNSKKYYYYYFLFFLSLVLCFFLFKSSIYKNS